MTTLVISPRGARLRFATGLLAGFLLGAGACWWFGFFSSHYHVIEESKICYSALSDHTGKLQPQTREYLKARLYSNAMRVSPQWMAETTSDIYKSAMGKHGLRPIPR